MGRQSDSHESTAGAGVGLRPLPQYDILGQAPHYKVIRFKVSVTDIESQVYPAYLRADLYLLRFAGPPGRCESEHERNNRGSRLGRLCLLYFNMLCAVASLPQLIGKGAIITLLFSELLLDVFVGSFKLGTSFHRDPQLAAESARLNR